MHTGTNGANVLSPGISDAEQEANESSLSRPFVALSKFVIANNMREEVKEAFAHRPHLVDAAPGFLRMDVISPLENPDEIWLITYWADEASFRIWHKSHLYHDAHRGIPKGLKLVPKSAKILYFEYISS